MANQKIIVTGCAAQNNPEMFNYVRETVNEGIRRGIMPQEENFINKKEWTK